MLSTAAYSRIQRQRRAKQRRELVAFSGLIAAPAVITPVTGVTLPANACLYVSLSTTVLVATHVLDVGPRAIHVPSISAGMHYPIGYFEQGKIVKLAAALASVLSLYVQDGVGNLYKIAGG